MKKGTKLVALLLGLALVAPACSPANNPGKSSGDQTSSEAPANYKVTINNKEELQAAWYVGDQSRKVSIEVEPKANVNQLVSEGKIQITSSDPTKLTISGQMASPVAEGEVTITVKCGESEDTVKVTLSPKQTVKEKYGVDHEGTAEDPLTNEDAVKIAETVGADATLEKFYIKGVVDSFRDAPSSYGNVSFYFTPATASGKKFLAYRVKLGEKNENVTDEHIWIGGTATVYVNIYNYNGNTPENNAGYLVKCEGERQTIENHEVDVAGAIAACKALGANGSSDGKDTYDVTGYIVYIDGNNLFLSDTKGAVSKNIATQFEVYGYSGDNANQCTLNAKIKVSCTIKYYVSSKDATNYAYETSTIEKVTILEAGDEPAIEITGAPALATVSAGTYKLGLLQKTLNKNLFFKGTVNSSKYAETSSEWTDAADVVVEGDATAGFKLKVGDKYLNPKVDGTSVKVALENTGITYAWNAVGKTMTTDVVVGTNAAEPFYLGAYNTNATFGFSKLSYLVDGDALKPGTNYAANFFAPAECNADPTAIQLDQKATAVVGVEYTMALRVNPYNVDKTKIVWESSDQTVATVAAGVVTPLKAGKTTIKAKFGTEIVDECELTCTEVNLGSLESPLTVAQALEAAQTLALTAGQFSPSKAYVEGTIEYTNDVFFNNYFGKWNVVDGENKLFVNNTKIADNAGEAYAGDKVVVSGYLTYDSTLKAFELLKKDNDTYPKIEKFVTRAKGTITVDEAIANATVSELSAQSADNGSTFTFKVTPAAGYKVVSVTVKNGIASLDQALTAVEGVYTGKVRGNVKIYVEVGEDVARTSYKLDGTVKGTGNSYAGTATVTQDGIIWNVQGNVEQSPWRIGGKSTNCTAADRMVYSQTALDMDASKIVITFGAASGITVNSMNVGVYSTAEKAAAGGEGDVANFTPTFAANGSVTVQKADSASWMNCYYNITLNLTSGSSSSNKFVEFKAVEFSLAE